jgi:hypothetical protein
MPSLNCGKPREKKQRKRERRHTCAPRAALPRCAKSMITSWASFNQVFGQTWIMLIEAGRCWHLSDLSAALRDFNSAYVAYGSNSAVSRFLRHGCFTPETGHCLARLARQKSANKRHMRRSKKHLYSITSSARASSVGGNSSPSAFAVFRLMTISILVENSIGRAPGFAPFKILSTNAAAWRLRRAYQISHSGRPQRAAGHS